MTRLPAHAQSFLVPREIRFGWILIVSAFLSGSADIAVAENPNNDVLMRALGDELQRSMTLRLGDLEPPYFVQYTLDDSTTHRLSATYGGLLNSNFSHERLLYSQVRVGSYDFDNSNFVGRGGFGGFRGLGSGTELPTDNDYQALRHAVWSATDSLYKSNVAALTQKRAYVRERNVADRPHDFSKVDASTSVLRDQVELPFEQATWKDRTAWEDYLRNISKQFGAYPHVQDANVSLIVGAETQYLVNSEGCRLRFGDTGASLRITAEVQAADGERISDTLHYYAAAPDQLPQQAAVLADVKKLADRIGQSMQASILEDYTGPVLVDGLAAAQLFRQLLGQGLAAQADPVGLQRRGDAADGLESRLGKRILPVTFHIYDDPRLLQFQETYLSGHYEFDDEGIPPERVEIVVDGKFDGMVTSRTPTKLFTKSNGHGRRGGGSTASSAIGCLFVESSKGLSAEELKKELIDAAEGEGLKFGLRISSIQNRGGGGAGGFAAFARRAGGGGPGRLVGDPISIYKVFVADGHEEPVRGCEFVALDVRSLRRIIAAGKDQTVHNTLGGAAPASSVIAPAVLFEELELSRIKQEAEKKPILAAPHARTSAAG